MLKILSLLLGGAVLFGSSVPSNVNNIQESKILTDSPKRAYNGNITSFDFYISVPWESNVDYEDSNNMLVQVGDLLVIASNDYSSFTIPLTKIQSSDSENEIVGDLYKGSIDLAEYDYLTIYGNCALYVNQNNSNPTRYYCEWATQLLGTGIFGSYYLDIESYINNVNDISFNLITINRAYFTNLLVGNSSVYPLSTTPTGGVSGLLMGSFQATSFGNYYYNLGFQYGYSQGVAQTGSVAYDKGYQDGYQLGYQDGKIVGENNIDSSQITQVFNQGYQDGYSQGLADSENVLKSPFQIITSALSAPISLLTTEIAPNITIGSIVLIPLVVAIVLFLLKALVM